MASAKKKVVNQIDLRKLMQERRGLSKSNERKINSPYAKYNSRGQLSCAVCNIVIKTENLWPSHVLNKSHKQNIDSVKEEESHASSLNLCRNGKRKADFIPTEAKKVCVAGKHSIDQKELPVERITNSTVEKKLGLMQDYSSSENDSDDETENFEELRVTSANSGFTNGLPPDFFDNQPSESGPSTQSSEALVFKMPIDPKQKKEVGKVPPTNAVEDLPEGFFDDPVLDAKARKVEYKDPMDEEWEKFQKTIVEENNVSEAIMEEDVEESTVERNIDQIDQQIHSWSVVEKLQAKKDEICQLVKTRNEAEESSDSADEEEYENLLNWRAKDY